MRTLDILIPQYKETEKDIKPLLDSIAIQQNINFDDIGVIITNDGTDVFLSDEFLSSYPYTIEYYKNVHKGVSATRNHCLDHSTAEYVMWCDADDLFFHACALWMVFNELRSNRFDMLVSRFVEETRVNDTGEAFFVNRDNDSTFVHGKVLRRQFLIKNNIRWNESLTIHEDSYFNCLARQHALQRTGGYVYFQTPFYLWKWRADSVCRHDPLYMNKTFINMLDSNSALVSELRARNLEKMAMSCALSMIYTTYYDLNLEGWWEGEGRNYLDQTERRFKEYWTNFKDLYEKVDNRSKLAYAADVRQKYFKKGVLDVKITFADWIKHIEEIED